MNNISLPKEFYDDKKYTELRLNNIKLLFNILRVDDSCCLL